MCSFIRHHIHGGCCCYVPWILKNRYELHIRTQAEWCVDRTCHWPHADRRHGMPRGMSHDLWWCHFTLYKQSRQDYLSLDTIYMLVGVAMYLGYRKNKYPLLARTQAEWCDDRVRDWPRADRRHRKLWGMSHDLIWCHFVFYKQSRQHALSLDTIYMVVAVAMYLGYWKTETHSWIVPTQAECVMSEWAAGHPPNGVTGYSGVCHMI